MALGHKRSGSRRSDVKGQKNESNILVDQDELKSNKIKTYFCIVLGAAAFLAFALVSNERFQSLDERLQHLERLLKTELGEVNQSDKLVSDSRQCSDDITVTSKTHNKRHNLDIRQKSLEQIKFDAKLSDCKDRESADRCAELAKAHGCNGAPGWMAVMCGATCDVCELLDPHVRCTAERVGMAAEPAFKPGEIGEMFSGLQERFPQYNVTYLSMPPEGPWVARIDNFLSDEEVEALIVKPGLVKRSTDQGSFDDDGVQTQVVSRGRTSENAWCMGACEQDKNVVRVTERISNITTVPSQNFESFQLLRYQAGQEYRKHHDASASDNNLLCGPRVLTFFLYLSDVEEGGGTKFTELDITMQPKRGSAILWPSVLDSDPTEMDFRTQHHALPVIKGTKYAANSWIHLYDYKKPNLWGCTGAFS